MSIPKFKSLKVFIRTFRTSHQGEINTAVNITHEICIYKNFGLFMLYGYIILTSFEYTVTINSHAKAPLVFVYNLATFHCNYSLSYKSNLKPLLKSCATANAGDKRLKRGKT